MDRLTIIKVLISMVHLFHQQIPKQRAPFQQEILNIVHNIFEFMFLDVISKIIWIFM